MKPKSEQTIRHLGDVAWCECNCHTKGSKWNKKNICKSCYMKPHQPKTKEDTIKEIIAIEEKNIDEDIILWLNRNRVKNLDK